MKSIVRLGMFETNSSSMHSVVIKKNIDSLKESNLKYACCSFESYSMGNEDNPSTVYIDMSSERENTRYTRQEANVIMNPDDKLYMYLVLGAYNLWNQVYEDVGENKEANPYEFNNLFKNFVKDLQKRIFDPMNINLIVNPPVVLEKYYEWNDGQPSYNLYWLPYIEDSNCTFDDLFNYLKEDDRALYSFIFSNESFVILGGDEYDSAYALNKIIKRGINYESKMFGYIEDPDD